MGLLMVLQRVYKFRITCDGIHPRKGGLCPCDIAMEGYSEADAFHYATSAGWTWDLHKGWRCNARDGHKEKEEN